MLAIIRIVFIGMIAGSLAGCFSMRHRAPALPPEYVPTPYGLVHRSCVRKLESNERINGDGVVTHGDGTTEKLAQCAFPRLDAHTQRPVGPSTHSSKSPAGTASPTADLPDGQWVEWRWLLANRVGSVSATFTAPPAPLQTGALLYLFPGIQGNVQNILQPVLQYGPSPEFPSNEGWIAASWYCCPKGWIHHTAAIEVLPGHTITGTITSTCLEVPLPPKCNWSVLTTDLNSGDSVTLRADCVAGIFQSVVGGALEAYRLNDCSQFPALPTTFANITVRDQNGRIASTSWQPPGANTSGLPPCGYSVEPPTPSNAVTLKY